MWSNVSAMSTQLDVRISGWQAEMRFSSVQFSSGHIYREITPKLASGRIVVYSGVVCCVIRREGEDSSIIDPISSSDR